MLMCTRRILQSSRYDILVKREESDPYTVSKVGSRAQPDEIQSV
jgi:hypothetical protein